MDIKNVGVVGCGIMGSGIAQTCAMFGYSVVVLELEKKVLDNGLAFIDKMLNRAVDKGKLSVADQEAIHARIKGTMNLDDFSGCDLIIEAVPEELDLKKTVFAKLDMVCPDHSILASNTSVLSVTDIAAATTRPEKVLGMHFSNPVPVMKILEVVKTIATGEEVVSAARSFGESIGKKVVLAKDAPGFISNRIFTPFLLNAVRLLESGDATKEDIDTLITEGLGHPMGPLALLDLIGIDTVFKGASAIYKELRDPQYNPPTLMRKMVAMGWHGRKTGKGFYDYS